jgi:hypothetical protein
MVQWVILFDLRTDRLPRPEAGGPGEGSCPASGPAREAASTTNPGPADRSRYRHGDPVQQQMPHRAPNWAVELEDSAVAKAVYISSRIPGRSGPTDI